MAGIVVTVTMGVMKPVLDKLGILMGDEYKKLKGLRNEVSFLKHELSDMAALLEKMDNTDELDPQTKHWRKDIIEMSYNIEDYIDDFMDHVGEAGDKVGILQKASHYLRTFKDRRRLANDVKKMIAEVIEASERRKRYMIDQCISNTAPVVVDPRLSGLYKDSASLVGIESQKEELVKWVLDEDEQKLKIMSIVGFGGLGKTTLANEVYREVGAQFNCKAFLSVSSKPDMMRLLNSILLQLEQQYENISFHVCEKDLIDNIRKSLQNKRYFIIVDDLWDIQAWNIIACTFPQNNQHSRVIITTRIEDVATACSSGHGCVYKMMPLSEQDSRILFFNRIFGSEDNCPPHFLEISCAILKKCGGLPLAIITVASILACQPIPLKEQWDDIENSLAIKSPAKSTFEEMMHILELSYKNLPSNLKACFLYLGTYPEDYKIGKADLVRQWVAEGFVSNSLGRDVWDVAESYFSELANRSMIQLVNEDDYNIRVSHCRVHDMMLELIIRKCREDNFISVVNDPQMMPGGQDIVVRRLTVNLNVIKDGTMAMAPTRHLSKVRSLSIFGRSTWIPPLLGFKSVRVLFLDISGICEGTVDLTDINRLSQLRYLKIEFSWHGKCKVLLGQMRSLQHLETLELCYPPSDCIIPADIVDLPCLSHLAVRGFLFSGLPDGIGKVKSLRSLYYFDMMDSSLENIKGIGQLVNLTNLFIYSRRHPSVSGQEVMAAWSSSLEKLYNLKCLVVTTTRGSEHLFADSWVSAPFTRLERLDVAHWIFSRVPSWISDLHNLRELSLRVQETSEEDVGVIGRLPSLVKLDLHIEHDISSGRMVIRGSTGLKFLKFFEFTYKGFSRLTMFEVGAMPSLIMLRVDFHEFTWDEGTQVRLHHLPSLREIVNDMVPTDTEVWVREAFQKAADALPGCPAFTVPNKAYRKSGFL